jgi:hypothetical protein
MNKTLIVIIYDDDILIHGRHEKDIDELIEKLQKEDLLFIKRILQRGIWGLISNKKAIK